VLLRLSHSALLRGRRNERVPRQPRARRPDGGRGSLLPSRYLWWGREWQPAAVCLRMELTRGPAPHLSAARPLQTRGRQLPRSSARRLALRYWRPSSFAAHSSCLSFVQSSILQLLGTVLAYSTHGFQRRPPTCLACCLPCRPIEADPALSSLLDYMTSFFLHTVCDSSRSERIISVSFFR
jgi:hypothetical protein